MGVDNLSLTVNSLSLNQGIGCLHKPISVLSLKATASITAVAWKGSILSTAAWAPHTGRNAEEFMKPYTVRASHSPEPETLFVSLFAPTPSLNLQLHGSLRHTGLSPDALRFSSFPSFPGIKVSPWEFLTLMKSIQQSNIPLWF